MGRTTIKQLLAISSLLALTACGGSDSNAVEPAPPSDGMASATSSGSEGGGNGGGSGNGGGGGNGGGEGGGVANIIFADTAVCGVDFVSISPQQLNKPANQRRIEIFSPCGPMQFDSFTTNDGAVNNQALECNAGAKARYESEYPVVNDDCS